MAVQADGKVLLAGQFTALRPNGAATPTVRNYIARLNADGSLDTGFDPNAGGVVNCLAVQADGKVLLGGLFQTLAPIGASLATSRSRIARLNADGTLDLGFDPNVLGYVYTLAVQANGQVLIGGYFPSLQPNGAAVATLRNNLARVNADGTLDATFDPNLNEAVNSLAVQADGKVLLGGSFTTLQPNGAATPAVRNYLARVNTDGTLDAGFDPNPEYSVRTMAVQANGQVLLGGGFTLLQPNGATTPTARNYIARVNADGSLDAGFDPNANTDISSLAVQADGKVLIAGNYLFTLQPNGAAMTTAREGFARLLNDPATQTLSVPSTSRIEWLRGGSSPEAQAVIFDLSTDNGATYTALGSATRISGGWEMTGLNLPANGQIRARARVTGGVGNGSAGLLQAIVPVSGPGAPELIVSGNSTTITNGAATPSLADLTDFGPVVAVYGSSARTFTIENAGSANLTLGTVTIGGANAAEFSVTIVPNPTVVAGASTTLQITFDPAAVGPRTATVSFSSNDSDEGAFTFSIQGLATLPTAGTLTALTIPLAVDPNIDSRLTVYATAQQPDGKTIIAGNFGMVLGVVRHNIARLNADGTLDLGFDPNVGGTVYCVAVQADGKVLLGGSFTTLSPNGDGPTIRRSIARVNADGTLDASFNPSAGSSVFSIVVQPDGKILLGGSFLALQPNGAATVTPRSRIARVNADGTLDVGFDPKANSTVNTIALQADGKVLLGGSFTTLQPNGAAATTARSRIARVNADGTLDATFDPKANSTVYSLVVQADGRILIGGNFTTLQPNGAVATTARLRLARVNVDGTLDPTFDPKANGNVFRRLCTIT